MANGRDKFRRCIDTRVAMAPGFNLNDAVTVDYLAFVDSLDDLSIPGFERNEAGEMSFSYPDLSRSIACLTVKQVERAMGKLREKKLVMARADKDNPNKKWYRVAYAKFAGAFGQEVFEKYGKPVEERRNKQGSRNEEPAEDTSRNRELVEENDGQGSRNTEPKLPKRGGKAPFLRNLGSRNRELPIYIESTVLKVLRVSTVKEDSVPNGTGANAPEPGEGSDEISVDEVRVEDVVEETPSGADAPPPPNMGEEDGIDEPKTVFAALARVAYHGLVVDEESKKLIVAAMGKVQSAKVRSGSGSGTVVLDVGMVEDYAIWRVLIQWKWHGQFPTIRQVENELRYEFLPWYGNETNRSTLVKFKQRYPNWRQRLFTGDYVEFHQEVQAFIEKSRKSGPVRQASSVVERHPWKGDDTHRQQEQISTTPELQRAAIQRLQAMKEKAEGNDGTTN